MKNLITQMIKKSTAIFMIAALVFTALPVLGTSDVYAASISASGTVSAGGAVLRKKPSSASGKVMTLSEGTSVTLKEEIFTSTSHKAIYRWYKVKTAGKTGYVRSDKLRNLDYGSEIGVTVDALESRTGPGTDFKKRGVIDWGTELKIMLPSRMKGSNEIWYKTKVKGKTLYLIKKYVARTTKAEPSPKLKLKGRPKIARALLRKPKRGGKARTVYTFNSKNCKRLFSVHGYSGITTPQGLAYTGKRYYVLYGNDYGQRIVTYSAKGKRLKATRFAFSIGHPNGMTWDPKTRLCYIFKGHHPKIYTWNPKTNKFGKSRTPYNASGGAYDPSTKMIYASSKPCMYTLSADGKFKLASAFGRCDHSFWHSAQDCGAGGGFLFHAVSGSNYRSVNYLDVYRISDRKYLGSIKVTLGEVESAIVDKKGYVELLINHSGHTDYVWRTPLNIKDLQ